MVSSTPSPCAPAQPRQWVSSQVLLCRRCSHHQTTKIKQLAAFTPRDEVRGPPIPGGIISISDGVLLAPSGSWLLLWGPMLGASWRPQCPQGQGFVPWQGREGPRLLQGPCGPVLPESLCVSLACRRNTLQSQWRVVPASGRGRTVGAAEQLGGRSSRLWGLPWNPAALLSSSAHLPRPCPGRVSMTLGEDPSRGPETLAFPRPSAGGKEGER